MNKQLPSTSLFLKMKPHFSLIVHVSRFHCSAVEWDQHPVYTAVSE
ncbi:hypothetical protein LEMLEM_LOCUS11318, partial [Lemmus lemmus]